MSYTATPLRAKGGVVTWRVAVHRGGEVAGAFETRLTRQQLGAAQFRPLADGTGSPLHRQVADVLRAPQKRGRDLGQTVELRNAPDGAHLQASIVAKQAYRDGGWTTVGYAVGEVRRYTWDPARPGQEREALGYRRASIGRGETVHLPDGSRPQTLPQAKARVEQMLKYRALTPVSDSGARAAAQSTLEQQRALGDLSARLGARGPATLNGWSPPVPLAKPLERMTPADRVGYTVEVAQQYLPADLGRELKALLTPQTAGLLAAYGAAHLTPVGWIADATALGSSAPGRGGERAGVRPVPADDDAGPPSDGPGRCGTAALAGRPPGGRRRRHDAGRLRSDARRPRAETRARWRTRTRREGGRSAAAG